jgi:hypothetical protein
MRFYETIEDFPIKNWFKCIETQDYSYTLYERKELTDDEKNQCKDKFAQLYAEYIDRYGINDELKEIIRVQNEILITKIDSKLNNDESLQNIVEILEIELKDLLSVKTTKSNTIKVTIEKWLGFRLNEKEVTVTEYYDYLEAIKQDKNNGRG